MVDSDTKKKLQGMDKRAAAKQIMEQQAGQQRVVAELLDFQGFKEPIRKSLLGVERQVRWVTPEHDDGLERPELREYVKMPSGKWRELHTLSEEEKEELYKDAVGNEKLVNDVISYLNSFANPNVGASVFSRHDVQIVGMSVEYNLVKMLVRNREKYDLNSPAEADFVVRAVVRPNLKGTLGKAKKGGLLKRLLENIQVRFFGDKEEEKQEEGGLKGLLGK